MSTRDQYAERTKRVFDFATSRGDAFDIAFRFDERVVGDGVAVERGVYRLSIVDPQRSEQVFHGRLNTVLRRTDMGWRLIIDQDDDEGGTVGGDAFDAARALDDTATFADG